MGTHWSLCGTRTKEGTFSYTSHLGRLTRVIALYLAISSLIAEFILGYFIATAVFGFATFPVVPVTLELMTRKFRNISYYSTESLMGVSSHVFSALMQTILSKVMDWDPENGGLAVSLVIMSMLLVCMLFVKGIDNDVS